MLQFIQLRHPDQIKSLLQKFDPGKQTWIVSDLRSKQEIQNECLKRFGFFTDDSILRVSDFWRLWVRRLKPTLQVVSSDFIKSLVQIFIDVHGSAISISANETSTLEAYVQELAPIILQPESDSILKEWLAAQENPKKWQKWYSIARVCISFIVNEKKVIDAKWSAAYLQSLNLDRIQWPQDLIIDLGTELTSIEMGLFKILSQKRKLQIYVPFPDWQKRFPFLLKTYTDHYGYGEVTALSPTEATNPTEKFFLRLSTQLSEVKYAVAQVRRWLDAGVTPDRIAVIAPQIEEYWPVMESYLVEEGVPARKDVVAAANSLSDTQIFLAHLKSLTTEISFESLQQKFFQNKKNPEIKFEKFKSLFTQIYDEEDLKRDEKVRFLFYRKVDLKAEMTRDEFMALLIKVWMDLPDLKKSLALFEVLFKDFLAQSLDTPMVFSRWLQFLRSRIGRKEIKVRAADPEGIFVLSLLSAQMNLADHRIYIGLYEDAFKVQRKSMLPLQDIEALKKDFDLAIQYPDESHLDFNLRWQSEIHGRQSLMLTPHLSFNAEPLTACLYFLENNPQSVIVAPPATRWDEVQKNLAFQDGQSIEPYPAPLSAKRLQQDREGAMIHVSHPVFHQLAVGDVENYAQCAFKLLASKGFRLRELPEVSIDLDPRQKGTLVHALFEHLVTNFDSSGLPEKEVQTFLEQKRAELGLFLNEEIFWDIQKNKLLTLAQKFWDFEKDRLKMFKSLTEVSFELHFDPQAKRLVKEKTPNSISIKGRIDRLDQHRESNYYLIYDYKSSGHQASSHPKWISDYQFQLLFYILAVENVLFEEADVKGALYYLYKNFDLSKGLVDHDIAVQDLQLSSRLKALINEEKRDALKKAFIEFLTQCFTGLQNGDFKAQPITKEICFECDWRKLCRAAHLM